MPRYFLQELSGALPWHSEADRIEPHHPTQMHPTNTSLTPLHGVEHPRVGDSWRPGWGCGDGEETRAADAP